MNILLKNSEKFEVISVSVLSDEEDFTGIFNELTKDFVLHKEFIELVDNIHILRNKEYCYLTAITNETVNTWINSYDMAFYYKIIKNSDLNISMML